MVQFLLLRSGFRCRLRFVLAVAGVVCLLAANGPCPAAEPVNPASAADPDPAAALPVVGLVAAAPFAMHDGNGNWQGIAVDLWRHVARDLDLRFRLQEMPPADLVTGVQQGTLLAVLTATASADRELLMDFSHPYYSSGLAIAVPAAGTEGDWLQPLADVMSAGTAKITGILLGLLLIAAVLVWWCERRVNPEHFRPQPLQGIGDGLWWAAVTLTTVGYGDKAPRSRAGRAIGVAWMFAAVILIALFTAQVTSSLTVTSLAGRVRGPADLVKVEVGTLQNSPPQAILRSQFGVRARGYPDFKEGLTALARGEIGAFVGAEPVLRYQVANGFAGRLTIVGAPFMRVDYVFALPVGSPLRKDINRSLLAYIETDAWQDLLRQYLGQAS